MRLDLYLKNTHLLKRRSSARLFAAEGRILVKGRSAKPGRDVRPGDTLTLLDEDGQPVRRVEILAEALHPVSKGRESDFYRELP